MTAKLTSALFAACVLAAACDQPAPPAVPSAPGPAPAVGTPAAAPVAPVAPAAPASATASAAVSLAAVAPTPSSAVPASATRANTHALPAAVALAPAPKATPLVAPAKADGKQPVNLIGAVASVPDSWRSIPPTNPMRVAQFVTPAASNGEPAEMLVFFFAAGRGGSQEDNIGRWKSQFAAPGGGPVEPKVSQAKVGEMAVTRVELAGSYSRGVGMGAAGEVKPDQVLLAAIVTTPTRGNLTLHFYGGRDAVNQHRAAFEAVVASLRPSGH